MLKISEGTGWKFAFERGRIWTPYTLSRCQAKVFDSSKNQSWWLGRSWPLSTFSKILWLFMCVIRLYLRANVCGQSWHANDFSPVCNNRCLFRFVASEKDLPQCSQAKGFSPVCVRECRFRLFFTEKRFPHSVHSYGLFSSLRRCKNWDLPSRVFKILL